MVKKEDKNLGLKAPRFRQESISIVDKTFIKDLKEKYPKYKDLDDKDIRNIIKRFNENFWKEVIETRDGVQLPEGLGTIFIGTCNPPVRESIDYAKSKKYGVKVSNKNWETDGKLAKIFFTSFSSRIKFINRECWSFIACRNFKRSVAKHYPENWAMYIKIDVTSKMRKTYEKYKFKTKKEASLKNLLKDYNEFDL